MGRKAASILSGGTLGAASLLCSEILGTGGLVEYNFDNSSVSSSLEFPQSSLYNEHRLASEVEGR